MTQQQELDLINTAIEQLLTANVKSYSINGRMVTKLDLPDLWKRKNELEAAIVRSGTSSFMLARFREAN